VPEVTKYGYLTTQKFPLTFNSFVPEVTKYGYLVTQKFPFRHERVNLQAHK